MEDEKESIKKEKETEIEKIKKEKNIEIENIKKEANETVENITKEKDKEIENITKEKNIEIENIQNEKAIIERQLNTINTNLASLDRLQKTDYMNNGMMYLDLNLRIFHMLLKIKLFQILINQEVEIIKKILVISMKVKIMKKQRGIYMIYIFQNMLVII